MPASVVPATFSTSRLQTRYMRHQPPHRSPRPASRGLSSMAPSRQPRPRYMTPLQPNSLPFTSAITAIALEAREVPRASSANVGVRPGARRTYRQTARPSPPRPPNVPSGVVASACLMYGVYRCDEPFSAGDLEQILGQGARAGGGGSPLGGTRWSPGPAFGAVARAQPAAGHCAERPKFGAGGCPVFEPSEADLQWVRERVWGGGGGPPAEDAHRDPGLGTLAGAHTAERPKFGAGPSPAFEPAEADLEWVRNRMWGGSASARG